MSQPSSLATLIVVSLLSCRPQTERNGSRSNGYSNSTRGRDNGDTADENDAMVNKILRGASVAFTIAFTMSSNIPPSSFSSLLELMVCELKKTSSSTQDSPKPSAELNEFYECNTDIEDDEPMCIMSSAPERAVNEDREEDPVNVMVKNDRAVVDSFVNQCLAAKGLDTKPMWRSGQTSRAERRRSKNTLLLSQMRRTPLQFEVVPEMQACDSSASISSLSSSSSIGSSNSVLSMVSVNKSRSRTMTAQQRNAEWTIME